MCSILYLGMIISENRLEHYWRSLSVSSSELYADHNGTLYGSHHIPKSMQTPKSFCKQGFARQNDWCWSVCLSTRTLQYCLWVELRSQLWVGGIKFYCCRYEIFWPLQKWSMTAKFLLLRHTCEVLMLHICKRKEEPRQWCATVSLICSGVITTVSV